VTQTPRIVLSPDADLRAAAARLAKQGWRPQAGFAVPESPWDLAKSKVAAVGPVRSADEAAAALLVAVRGGALAVVLDDGAPWATGFRADLARLDERDAPSRPATGLNEEQEQILELLADGMSIPQASRALYLSLRTANRRLAQARSILGAANTSEAVVAFIALRDGR
jgi:DNA-binding CsgD family transcriptional regulator